MQSLSDASRLTDVVYGLFIVFHEEKIRSTSFASTTPSRAIETRAGEKTESLTTTRGETTLHTTSRAFGCSGRTTETNIGLI
jgi:hypothetical protein